MLATRRFLWGAGRSLVPSNPKSRLNPKDLRRLFAPAAALVEKLQKNPKRAREKARILAGEEPIISTAAGYFATAQFDVFTMAGRYATALFDLAR